MSSMRRSIFLGTQMPYELFYSPGALKQQINKYMIIDTLIKISNKKRKEWRETTLDLKNKDITSITKGDSDNETIIHYSSGHNITIKENHSYIKKQWERTKQNINKTKTRK